MIFVASQSIEHRKHRSFEGRYHPHTWKLQRCSAGLARMINPRSNEVKLSSPLSRASMDVWQRSLSSFFVDINIYLLLKIYFCWDGKAPGDTYFNDSRNAGLVRVPFLLVVRTLRSQLHHQPSDGLGFFIAREIAPFWSETQFISKIVPDIEDKDMGDLSCCCMPPWLYTENELPTHQTWRTQKEWATSSRKFVGGHSRIFSSTRNVSIP